MRAFGLVLIALVISANAMHYHTGGVVSRSKAMFEYGQLTSKQDVVNFLKGLAVGLDVIMGDPAACVKEFNAMVSDFNNAVQLIGDGIKTLNVKEVSQGLLAFADGVENVAQAFKDCGIEKTAESIIKIVSEIRNGEVEALIKDEIIHIFAHGRDLIQLFKDIPAQWKAKAYYAAGKDVGEILGILIDQDNLQITVSANATDIYKLIRGVAEGMGSTMGDPSGCARDIDVIIADMNAAWSDLVTGIKKVSVKTIERALLEFADAIETIAKSFDACGLSGLEKAIRDIVADIRAGKVFQVLAREAVHIYCHGKELIDDFKSVATLWNSGAFEECGKKVGEIIGFLVVIPPAQH